MCVCGALHFGSDTFFGCNCCVSDNFLLPVPVLDVYKYVYIILIIIVARRKHLHSVVYLAAKLDRITSPSYHHVLVHHLVLCVVFWKKTNPKSVSISLLTSVAEGDFR